MVDFSIMVERMNLAEVASSSGKSPVQGGTESRVRSLSVPHTRPSPAVSRAKCFRGNGRKRKSLARALLAVVLIFVGATLARSQSIDMESFETGVPPSYTATRPGSLSVTPWHNKHGKSSLRWDWAKGEDLVIHHGIGDVARTGGFQCNASFVVWVYEEKPVSGALVFEFREGEKVAGSFSFPLGFTGWRQARLFYHDFPSGKPTSQVDNIRVVSPANVAKGTVFLDSIWYNALSYPATSINPEQVAAQKSLIPDERRFPKPAHVTEAELAGIRALEPVIPVKKKSVAAKQVNDLCDKVNALGIVSDEHDIHGPGLDGGSYYCSATGEFGLNNVRHWPDELGPKGPVIASPKAEIALATEVAKAYRDCDDAAQRSRLAGAFLLLADHLQDQGEAISPESFVIMRELLAQVGQLESHLEPILRATRNSDLFFVGADVPVVSSMDFYDSYCQHLLNLCFLQVDPAEQVRWLNAWKANMERSLLEPSGAFKIDGSAYHHSGHYHSYAQGAFGNFPKLVRRLRDTPWRFSPEAHDRLRRAMLAQRIYANRFDLPVALRGRSPFTPGYGLILPYGVKALEVLALMGTPDGKEAVDREVAAAYLRLDPTAASKEPYSSLGIKPEPEPDGTFVMPYAGLLCQRRSDWLASIKGQSKYIWGSERQDRRNCYGLFMGLGNLEILAGGNPVSSEASGCDGAGWDWARFEGTTAPHLPLKQLDKGWSRVSARASSPEAFVGGLSHQGRQGIFAMVLNATIRPENRTIHGKKSWFFIDDRILCLGSGISCDEPTYPTQTNLCQKTLQPKGQSESRPTLVDGAGLTAFPVEQTLDPAKPHWFLDTEQNGYYVPEGQKVTIARTHQTSRDVDDLKDTEGDFLTAWIDHGKAPAAASYEYMLMVRATPQALAKVVTAPPYKVVQRDEAAHIVWDAVGRRWACVLFVPQELAAHTVTADSLPLKAVDRACLVMLEPVQNGRLDLSVADPDLNLVNDESQPRPLRVTLHGAWHLSKATGTVCAWKLPDVSQKVRVVSGSATETVLEIVCQHGASYDISLAQGLPERK